MMKWIAKLVRRRSAKPEVDPVAAYMAEQTGAIPVPVEPMPAGVRSAMRMVNRRLG